MQFKKSESGFAGNCLNQEGVKDKGDIYEGLLEKNAEDTKSGAGQLLQ